MLGVVADHRNIRGVALVAGARMGEVVDADAHSLPSTTTCGIDHALGQQHRLHREHVAHARLAGAAGPARSVHVHGADLEADGVRRLAVMGAAGHAQAHFIRLRPALELIVQARHADQIDAEIVVGEALQLQPFLDDLGGPFGARHRVDAAIGHLALADIAVGIADIDLVGRCRRAGRGVR